MRQVLQIKRKVSHYKINLCMNYFEKTNDVIGRTKIISNKFKDFTELNDPMRSLYVYILRLLVNFGEILFAYIHLVSK